MDRNPDQYALYLRKSKGRAGIARQRSTTTAHVARLGGVIAREFADTDRTAFQKTAGARPRRDAFDELLGWLRDHPGTGVAAWHADRLSRNGEDARELIRVCTAGGHLIVTRSGGTYDLTTANGRKQFNADVLDAEYEVDHMTERILEMKAEHRADGRWLGGRRPFGWQPDKDAPGGLVLDEAEAAALAKAHDAVLAGTSLSAIAREWNAAGLTGTSGARWTGVAVGDVLRRPSNGAPPPARWPAVVPLDTSRAVIAILSRPGRKPAAGPERRHLLSGIAVCGAQGCGAPLWATSTVKDGRQRTVYRCSASRGHVARDQAMLDDVITRLVIGRLSLPDAAGLLEADTSAVLARLRGEEAQTEGLMSASNDLRRRGLLTPGEFAEERAEHLASLEGTRRRIAAAERDSVLAPMLADPAGTWKRLGPDRRRAVIAALMAPVVLPARKGRPRGWAGGPYFDPDAVKPGWINAGT